TCDGFTNTQTGVVNIREHVMVSQPFTITSHRRLRAPRQLFWLEAVPPAWSSGLRVFVNSRERSLCYACPCSQAFHHPRMRINPGCFRRCSPVPHEVIVLIPIGANRRLPSELKLLPLLLPYLLVCQQSTGKNL